MGRRQAALALVVFALLAAALLHEGLGPGRVLVSAEAQRHWLPWSAVLPPAQPHNRFLVDQPQIFYPYLLEAQRVYRGETDALWTSRGGGGLPFLGNFSSSLLHPLTLLAALLPITAVPIAGALATLALSALFTWLFLRRLGVSAPASALAAVGFGFGGHQVLWLQYALSHTLLALPFICWATERVVERRSPRRLAVLAAGFALAVLGGHPETTAAVAAVGGGWVLFRLRDRQGLLLSAGVAALAVALAAVQWLPSLEYVLASRGLHLRNLAHGQQTLSLSFAAAFGGLCASVLAVLLLRGASRRGGWAWCLAAVGSLALALLVARAAGLSASAAVLAAPELYGSPVGGGDFTASQDFPGLNAGFTGVLPLLLALLGAACGLLRGPAAFFAWVAALLWGAAFHLPGVEGLLRALPGLDQMQATRFLGPAGFALACCAAFVLDRLAAAERPADLSRRALRAGGCVAGALALCVAFDFSARASESAQPDAGSAPPLIVTEVAQRHGLPDLYAVQLPLDASVQRLRLRVGREIFFDGPPDLPAGATHRTLRFAVRRLQAGRHRLIVELERDGQRERLADQTFVVQRNRTLSPRDGTLLILSLLAITLLVVRRARPALGWGAAALVAADVLSFGHGYNAAAPVHELYPPTATTDFLAAQPPPFRVLTEGTILPPDTQFAVGVDHLLSYDNIGYQSNYRLMHQVPIDTDAFWQFRSSRETTAYDSPRFDLLDVRFVLTDTATDLSDIAGFVLVHESETRIWENTRNLGRVFITPHAVNGTVTPVSELLALDLRTTVLLEQDPGGAFGGRGSATVLEHRGATVRVRTETDGPALLVLAENWAPGWTAQIDDGPAVPTLRANGAWQAVAVPAGRHELLFRYRPTSFRVGLALSLCALAAAAVLALRGRPLHAG